MDSHTPQQRHRNMAAIHSKDTKPEMLVRKYLWSRGFRYRINNPRLPGKPDIVLRKYRTCYVVPKTNTKFWLDKINQNRQRDKEQQQKLAKMGWHSITVWECELKPKAQGKTLEALAYTLNHIYLEDHSLRYKLPEEELSSEMAAEPNPIIE